MALISVRRTAECLGVHENTIRNWEARGILRAIRLPGSGFRRFPEEQVYALAEKMRADLAPYHRDPEVVEDSRIATGEYDPILEDQD